MWAARKRAREARRRAGKRAAEGVREGREELGRAEGMEGKNGLGRFEFGLG